MGKRGIGARHPVTGAQALAIGAIEAGVGLVTGYPGSPATAVINHIMKATRAEDVRVEWTSNEKVAIEMAFGAALGGMRSLLCIKSVGLNVALDPLMVYNLSGCRAGFVILVGDDPEGWGSQNEQDSRALALACELPLIEPVTVSDSRLAMLEAFRYSEQMNVPVLVRVTRALAEAKGIVSGSEPAPDVEEMLDPESEERPHSIVLPVNVVPLHRHLLDNLSSLRSGFAGSPLNHIDGNGLRGIIAAGFAYQKLLDTLHGSMPPDLCILGLGTPHPLPEDLVAGFLGKMEAVLVLEETAPLVEMAVLATAYRAMVSLPIYGRRTSHVPGAGELLSSHIVEALRATLLPDLPPAATGDQTKPMPSRVPLCEGCPYTPTFAALTDVMNRMGGRDHFIVAGDPGCMVRSQMSQPDLLDVKHGLGSSIGMATGLAISLSRASAGQAVPVRRVIALAGDSSFLHTGFNALMDTARMDVDLLVIILDNGTVALTGGQPHPGTPLDARGRRRPAVSLAALAQAAGATLVHAIDANDGAQMRTAIGEGLQHKGVAVVISHGACPPNCHKE